MAYSAQISVTPGSSNSGQKLRCQFTITGTPGSSAVSVLRVDPYLLNAAGTAQDFAGKIDFPIGRSLTISPTAALAGSLAFSYESQPIVNSAPLNPVYPSTPVYETYTIGAVAYLSDGTTASSSTTIYIYPLVADSSFALTVMPQPGSLRFDTNTESAFVPVAIVANGALVPAVGYAPRGPLPVSGF